MNTLSFIDICRGEFGRRVCKVAVSKVTKDNVLDVLADTIGDHNVNRGRIKYLFNYYKGDMPINYKTKKIRPEINHKVAENHALEVVRFKVSQNYGEPIQYVSRSKEANVNSAVDALNDYMDNAHADARNIEMGIYQSSVGTAYKAVLKEDDWKKGDKDTIPFGILVPDPMNTYIVYSELNNKRLMSVQSLYELGEKRKREQYYLIFTKDEWFRVKNGKIVEMGKNWFEDIPIVEYPNNSDRLSDIEICITIFDAINDIASNRIDSIDQFVQALMKFKNCEIDEETFKSLAYLGAISVRDTAPGMQSDVQMMTAELDQQQTQTAKDDLYNQVLTIEGMPNRNDKDGGSTGDAVYLRNGWQQAEKRALLDAPFVKEAEQNFAKVVLNVLRKTSKDVDLGVRDFEVRLNRNPTDNMLVKAQALDYLVKNKIDPLIALTTCGLFGDPQKVYEKSWEWMKQLYTSEEELVKRVQSANTKIDEFASQMQNEQKSGEEKEEVKEETKQGK